MWATDRAEVSVMTEEQARFQAEVPAIGMGITYYVVRSPEGRGVSAAGRLSNRT